MEGINNALLMKEKNRKRILSLIREKSQSRADLARQTGLSRAAVTLIVNALINEELVIEGDVLKSDTGRRPTMLKIRPEAFISIGVDINRSGCNIVFSNFASEVLCEISLDFEDDAQSSIEKICEVIRFKIDERFSNMNVLGVGISCPGPIDSAKGVILNPPGLDVFHNCNIRDAIKMRLGIPAVLEKDTNVLAISEKNMGLIDQDFLFLLADHGIGCGVIKEGKLFSARRGMGCEIGHITLKFDGERCRCGNIGCAELYASIPAILAKAEKNFGEPIEWNSLIRLTESNDETAIKIMNEYISLLSIICVSAVNLFEPECIVLGGKLKSAYDVLKSGIEERLAQSMLSRSSRIVRVLCSSLDKNSRAFAAAELVIENYLTEV